MRDACKSFCFLISWFIIYRVKWQPVRLPNEIKVKTTDYLHGNYPVFNARFAPIPDATIYVGGLDDKVTESLLWELFVQGGPVGKQSTC